jgi:cell division protein DivIC
LKKYIPILKNRYLVSSLVVLIYILVMHDTDVYTLWKRQQKVASLEAEIDRRQAEIGVLKENLASLQDLRSLEKYARETHYFKKDDEELFIFSFE